jgi:hypothetical protein
VLLSSQRWFSFPFQPICIFDFWITLVFKKIMDRLTPENEDITLFRNVGRPVPKDTVPQLAKLESSTTPM